MQRQRGDSPTKGIPVFAVILMAAILIAAGCGQDLPQSITVVSWGGSYGRAVDEGAIIPFTEATGIPVDVEDYNGGRVPQGNLEFALVGDGVPPDQVYPTLNTPEGLARAFRKLETIKDEVIWWEAGAQPPQLLADGEVVMSTAYNGRIFNAQVLERQPFVIVWDGQLLAVGQIGIVRGTPRLEAALRYVGFATSAESLARIGSRISYSPTRKSGVPLVTTHLATGVEMEPHMPASPANAARALRYDWSFWVDHQDELNERFSTWLAR